MTQSRKSVFPIGSRFRLYADSAPCSHGTVTGHTVIPGAELLVRFDSADSDQALDNKVRIIPLKESTCLIERLRTGWPEKIV